MPLPVTCWPALPQGAKGGANAAFDRPGAAEGASCFYERRSLCRFLHRCRGQRGAPFSLQLAAPHVARLVVEEGADGEPAAVVHHAMANSRLAHAEFPPGIANGGIGDESLRVWGLDGLRVCTHRGHISTAVAPHVLHLRWAWHDGEARSGESRLAAEELCAGSCAVHSAALRRRNVAGAAAAAGGGGCTHGACDGGEACGHASAAPAGRLEFPLECAEVRWLVSFLDHIVHDFTKRAV